MPWQKAGWPAPGSMSFLGFLFLWCPSPDTRVDGEVLAPVEGKF